MARLIVGVDEVGRGPLAGPVVAAAVILDPEDVPDGLTDSKKLSARRRESLAIQIKQNARAISVAQASVAEIDQLNILAASMLAMRRAVLGLDLAPDLALVDGNRLPELPCRAHAIVKGDARCRCIGAASIVAKVFRDRLMADLDRDFPAYGWARNAGYGVAAHMQALRAVGPSPHHRKSFTPVRALIVGDSPAST